jgi:hypothetical protein
MESEENHNRFSSLPTAPGNRWRDFHISTAPTIVFPLKTKNKEPKPKGEPCHPPILLGSGSSFDEKMLLGPWAGTGLVGGLWAKCVLPGLSRAVLLEHAQTGCAGSLCQGDGLLERFQVAARSGNQGIGAHFLQAAESPRRVDQVFEHAALHTISRGKALFQTGNQGLDLGGIFPGERFELNSGFQ